jgi:transcriptional regulator PpsR
MVAIASDIALVVGPDGIIRNVAQGRNPVGDDAAAWVGRPWVDTVTADTRKKIEQLLSEASTNGVSQRREVNHPSVSGTTIPVTYAAIRLGEDGPLVVAGRDLRAIAAIQQRFLDSQQEMERSYWSRRQAESRYRLLFQAATDAVLVVDAESLKVVDTNPAATRLLKMARDDLVGASPVMGIEAKSRRAVEEMLVTARATGNPAEIRVRLAHDLSTMAVSATPFRGNTEMLLLVRLSGLTDHRRSTDSDFRISGMVENMQEPVVITDSGGRLLMANPAFLQMCQLSREDQIKGMSLGEWLGNAEHDMAALLAEIRHRGIASSIPATISTRVGKAVPVELSAALLTDGEQEHIGITIRHHAKSEEPATLREVTRKLAELTDLLGHASIAELISSLTQLAERHFVQVALERTQGDEGAAAALLGIAHEDLAKRLRASHGGEPGDPKPTLLH